MHEAILIILYVLGFVATVTEFFLATGQWSLWLNPSWPWVFVFLNDALSLSSFLYNSLRILWLSATYQRKSFSLSNHLQDKWLALRHLTSLSN